MARGSKATGVSPAGKLGIIAVAFGVPILFFAASWGLDVLFQAAPWVAIVVLVLVATAYTARTSGLLHDYYAVQSPILRFIPCICEVTLIDLKYRPVCYILYGVALVMAGGVAMPYSMASMLGNAFTVNHVVWFGLGCGLALAAIQVIKGIGISGCMKDIANDWYSHTHSDVGLIKRFTPLGFIPFVRVIALYSLNKPLDTLVSFAGVDVNDIGQEDEFYEEDEDDE